MKKSLRAQLRWLAGATHGEARRSSGRTPRLARFRPPTLCAPFSFRRRQCWLSSLPDETWRRMFNRQGGLAECAGRAARRSLAGPPRAYSSGHAELGEGRRRRVPHSRESAIMFATALRPQTLGVSRRGLDARPRRSSRLSCTASATENPNLVTVTLPKPLGIVFEEREKGKASGAEKHVTACVVGHAGLSTHSPRSVQGSLSPSSSRAATRRRRGK